MKLMNDLVFNLSVNQNMDDHYTSKYDFSIHKTNYLKNHFKYKYICKNGKYKERFKKLHYTPIEKDTWTCYLILEYK